MKTHGTSNQSEVDPNAKPMPPAVTEIPKGMDLVNHVAQSLAAGCDPIDVRKQLMTFGFSEANADKYIADTRDWMSRNSYAGTAAGSPGAQPERFNGHMIIGIIALIIGVGVTVFTYLRAIGGGTYIVAWGAILFGIVEIMRGFGPSRPPDESSSQS